MRLLRLSIIGFLAVAGIASAQSFRQREERGATLYAQRCGGCHGLDGKANTSIGKKESMRDLTAAEVQRQTDEDLKRTIANGRGRMPAYQLILGDARIQLLIDYIKTMPN
jgi:mono/diheme cytochrome c family protein